MKAEKPNVAIVIQRTGKLGNQRVIAGDGGVAYHLANVVDDGREGVTRVVRGRDLETRTDTQIALQGLLGLQTPGYRHHFLLLESRGEKLAKLHGSVSAADLQGIYEGPALCGVLAHAAGGLVVASVLQYGWIGRAQLGAVAHEPHEPQDEREMPTYTWL